MNDLLIQWHTALRARSIVPTTFAWDTIGGVPAALVWQHNPEVAVGIAAPSWPFGQHVLWNVTLIRPGRRNEISLAYYDLLRRRTPDSILDEVLLHIEATKSPR